MGTLWIRLVASHSGEAAMWRWRAAATAAATSGHAAGRGHRAVRAATASATSMVAVRAKQQEEEATASVTSLHAQSHGHRAVRDATASATSLHAAGRGHRAVRAATPPPRRLSERSEPPRPLSPPRRAEQARLADAVMQNLFEIAFFEAFFSPARAARPEEAADPAPRGPGVYLTEAYSSDGRVFEF